MEKNGRKSAIVNQEFEKAVEDMINDRKSTPYERTRNAVYSTGNKWAKENFNDTHG